MVARDREEDRAERAVSWRHWQLYGRPEYARLRRRCLDRDGWRCRACGKAGRLELDHVVPLQAGGAAMDASNLQALCRRCHFLIRDEAAIRLAGYVFDSPTAAGLTP